MTPLCFSNAQLSQQEISDIVKNLLGEKQEICDKIGLRPFYAQNLAPPVRKTSGNLIIFVLLVYPASLTCLAAYAQADSNF